MAVLRPFRAYRPHPEFVEEMTSVPYDVINSDEARQLAEGKAKSFLHVIRPEIDFPQEVSIYSDEVYEKGKENLNHLLESDAILQEDSTSHYVYQMVNSDHTQTGIFSCVSVKDYDDEVILKHELTRPDKEDDRTRHIMTQQAHAEPVMMTFKDNGEIKSFIKSVIENSDPLYDFAADGVKHRIWRVDETDHLTDLFVEVEKLYITDGHHRCKSASRVCADMGGDYSADYAFFPAVLFPMDEMCILPYNRIVYTDPYDGQFGFGLDRNFEVTRDSNPTPANKSEISIYLDGTWYGVSLPESEKNDPVSEMDVSRLYEHILRPMLQIEDQRTDPNINFVGGSRGIKELERLVDEGIAEIAISMYPTSIEELIAVSDAGLLMPPKSTWFEPKVRSGILIHTF